MAEAFKYVIAGGGLAGASAIKGIREIDKDGTILLVGSERHMPYDRPPLSKKLWSGKKKVEDIFLQKQDFYEKNGVRLLLGERVSSIDTAKREVSTPGGRVYGYERLLIATGGMPKRIPVPGGDIDGICYFRTLDDYLRIRAEAVEGRSAVVIGGGFIGSEIAAALDMNRLKVTMIYPSAYLVSRVFPEPLGRSLEAYFIGKGISIVRARPVSISKKGGRFVTETEKGVRIESDILIAGAGITPETELASGAGIRTGDGVMVDEYLGTSAPGVFAAGDNARFPYRALGKDARVEHWDNALNQGHQAGRNMAGAKESYTYMPYFFSDLFEFGYEAVGEVDSRLDVFADWVKENDTGVIYYLKDGFVRGVMLCNIWERVDKARELILRKERVERENLRGLIR